MLARNGVQHLRVIDFDQVTLSSLNRHAVATRADVGRPKTEVKKKKKRKREKEKERERERERERENKSGRGR